MGATGNSRNGGYVRGSTPSLRWTSLEIQGLEEVVRPSCASPLHVTGARRDVATFSPDSGPRGPSLAGRHGYRCPPARARNESQPNTQLTSTDLMAGSRPPGNPVFRSRAMWPGAALFGLRRVRRPGGVLHSAAIAGIVAGETWMIQICHRGSRSCTRSHIPGIEPVFLLFRVHPIVRRGWRS